MTDSQVSSKKTRSEQKREAIIEAARQAFQTDGVQNTSMDKLAAMAQVSKRTVYNHFASKEALVMHILTDLWQRTMHECAISYNQALPLQDQLEQLLLAELEMLSSADYQELSRVAFGHFFYHPEALQQELARFSFQETALLRWLQAAVKDEQLIVMDTSVAQQQLHNLIKGSAFWPQLMKMSQPLSKAEQQALAKQTAELFLSHYQKK